MTNQESAGQEYPDGMRDAGKRAIDAMKVERNESNARARAAENRVRELRGFLTKLGNQMERTLAEIDRQAAKDGDTYVHS